MKYQATLTLASLALAVSLLAGCGPTSSQTSASGSGLLAPVAAPADHVSAGIAGNATSGSEYLSDAEVKQIALKDAGLEHLIRGPVVDGNPHVDLRDRQIAHHSVAADVQNLPVFRLFQVFLIRGEYVPIDVVLCQCTVKLPCGFPFLGEILRCHLLHRRFIAADQTALPVGIPLIRDRRIGKNAKTDQKQKTEQDT